MRPQIERSEEAGYPDFSRDRIDARLAKHRGVAVHGPMLKLGKFPVVGFIKDPSGVAVLYLGKQEGKELVYLGKVGTGWSRTVSAQIRKQLETVVSPKAKLTKAVRKPKATWVEPKFFADVEYRDVTSEGLLRASSFKGLSKE